MRRSRMRKRKIRVTNKSVLLKIRTYRLSSRLKKAFRVSRVFSEYRAIPQKIIVYKKIPGSGKIKIQIIFLTRNRSFKAFKIQPEVKDIAVYSIDINKYQNEKGGFINFGKPFRKPPEPLDKLSRLGGLIFINEVFIQIAEEQTGKITKVDSANYVKGKTSDKAKLEDILGKLRQEPQTTSLRNNLGCTFALLGKFEKSRYKEAKKTFDEALQTQFLNELINKIIHLNMEIVDNMSQRQ